jgi:hypothetical protein
MQKRQFLRSLKDFDRQWQWNFLWLEGLLLLMFVVVPFGLRHVPSTVIGSLTARRLLFQLTSLALLVCFALVVDRARRRLALKFPFACGHCAEAFSQADLAELGYTDTCRACGERVFDETTAASLNPSGNAGGTAQRSVRGLPTRAGLLTSIRDFRKGGGQMVTIVLGAVILLPLTLLLLVPVANGGDLATIIWRSALVLCCLIGVLVYSHFARKRAARRYGLACPCCRHVFNPQELKYLGYSGQCEHCKTKVFL